MSELNLLPESYVKERMRYRIDLLCVLLFAVIMGGLIVIERTTRGKLETAKKEYVETNARYTKAVNKTKTYFQLQSKRDKLLKQVEAAATVTQRIPRSYLLAIITNARSTNMLNLTKLNIIVTIPKSNASSASSGNQKTVRGKSSTKPPPKTESLSPVITIELEGNAQTYDDVKDFFKNLKRCDAIDEENATWPVTREPTKSNPRSGFEIKLKVKKDLDVLNLLKSDKPTIHAANGPDATNGKGTQK
ncbi:MAG: hypothetical protein K8S55_03075 [Phycisphaerae bacterium]|nr:hypothetical protein [Phycisphaerae bacterium]